MYKEEKGYYCVWWGDYRDYDEEYDLLLLPLKELDMTLWLIKS